MQFDDRLATVLRQKAGASAGARTQYRQLLDLLGRPQPGRDPSLLAAARLRLDSLADVISVRERAEIVREQGRRLNDPALVAHFAEAEPDIASATLSTARLTEAQWLALIPELPVRARGFLRLRRDLPEKVDALLERLGVHDRALPLPPEPEIFLISLATYETEALAEAAWEDMRNVHAGLLRQLPHELQPTDLSDDSRFYVLIVGPLDSRVQSRSLCGALRAHGSLPLTMVSVTKTIVDSNK